MQFALSLRVKASFLLALVLCGPVGPLGAAHVAKADLAFAPSTVDHPTVEQTVDGTAAHGPSCLVCHLLTGLRWTAEGPFSLDPALGPTAGPVAAPVDSLLAPGVPLRPGRAPPAFA
jgi:hypothetical protein